MKQRHIRALARKPLAGTYQATTWLLALLLGIFAATSGTAQDKGMHANDVFAPGVNAPSKENKLLGQTFEVDDPTGIAIDSARGRILISNRASGFDMAGFSKEKKKDQILGNDDDGGIYAYGSDSTFIDSLFSPFGLEIVEDTLYICEVSKILAYNLVDTSKVFTMPIDLIPGVEILYDVATDTSGNLYFSSYENNYIIRMVIGSRIADTIAYVGENLEFPSAMIFDAPNNRMLYGTATWRYENDNDTLMSKLKALDLDNDSCYTIMELGFRNVAGITRNSNGDYYLSQGNDGNDYDDPADHSFIYELKGDFSEAPEIITVASQGAFGMLKVKPGTDTLIFSSLKYDDVWIENMSYLVAKPRLIYPSPNRDSIAQECYFSWETDRDSLAGISNLVIEYADTTDGIRAWGMYTSLFYWYDRLKLGREYRWFVQGRSNSDWFRAGISDTSYFSTYPIDSVPTVNIISPLDSATSVPVHLDFKWNKFPGATRYQLEFYERQWGIDKVTEYLLNDTVFTIFPSLSNSDYWWRIKVVQPNLSTGWTDYRTCKTVINNSGLDTVELYFPPVGGERYGYSINQTLEWESIPGATEYMLEINTWDPIFTTDTTYTLSLDTNRNYYWGVVAINDSTYSAGSRTFLFSTGDTSVVPPGIRTAMRSSESDLRPTLYWDNDGAVEYLLVVTEEWGSEFGKGIVKDHILQEEAESWDWSKVILEKKLTSNSYRFEEDLDEDAIYKWRVRAKHEIKGKTVLSDFTDPMKFKLEDIEVGVGDDKYGINVYPNPISKGNLLFLESNEKLINKVEIIDNLGQLVYSSKLNMNSKNHIINTGNIQSGSYYLRISVGKEIITRKFVVI
jgi:Secretion system C-terminal sorting domain